MADYDQNQKFTFSDQAHFLWCQEEVEWHLNTLQWPPHLWPEWWNWLKVNETKYLLVYADLVSPTFWSLDKEKEEQITKPSTLT